jgi:undecaprenyl-diphosphatase
MTDFFYTIDLSVFYFINHTLSTGFLDKFFAVITNVNNWYIAYVILLGISFFKGGKKGRIAVIGVIILILVTDQTSAHLLKEIIRRIRPCNALTDVITPLGCTGSYSFPSNHAFNNFAAAVFYYRLFPRLKWILFITASLIAISRVYLGLHYPSDILGGALLGVIFGYIFAEIALRLVKKFSGQTVINKDRSTNEENQ